MRIQIVTMIKRRSTMSGIEESCEHDWGRSQDTTENRIPSHQRRRSSYFRDRLVSCMYHQMNQRNAVCSPMKGRKYSNDVTRFQQAPGAPRPSLKHSSVSALYQPDEMIFSAKNVSTGAKRRYDQADSEVSFEDEAFSAALIGAPRLNLSQSTVSAENSNDFDCSMVSNLSEKATLHPIETASTPGPGINIRKKSTAFNFESPIALNHEPNQFQCKTDFHERPSILVFRCRICYEEGSNNEPLVSPCHCRGTVGLLHKRCLEKWLQVSQTLKCEICGYAYILRPKAETTAASTNTTKYSATQVIERIGFFRDWLHSHLVQRNIATDLFFLILLIPATCVGVYFCITAVLNFVRINPYAWQVIALIALATTLISALFCWIVLATKHHISAYLTHRHRREERIREAIHRHSMERRWRFSVQPRPRGSSFALQTSTPEQLHERHLRDGNESGTLGDIATSPPQCSALINVTSPNFTLNLYPVEETTETTISAENSRQDVEQRSPSSSAALYV